MSRYTCIGAPEEPRRTFETPVMIHQEWPDHIARCCAAIRARRAAESGVLVDGEWQ